MPIVGGGSGGGGGGLTFITDQILGADTATFDFQNLPQTYAHLYLIGYLRSSAAATQDNLELRFNNDSGSNYLVQALDANNATVSAFVIAATTQAECGKVVANSATAGLFGFWSLWIPSYTLTTNQKICVAPYGEIHGATGQTGMRDSNWTGTAAINRITLFNGTGPNFKAGSRVTIYGLSSS